MSDLSTRRLRSLTDGDIDRILSRADEQSRSKDDSRRRHRRFTLPGVTCTVHIQQPGAAATSPFEVRTRNISAGGVSFLHGTFVHPGSRITIELERTDAGTIAIEGRVVHCRYLEQGLHEVAVAFDALVRPSDFCPAALLPWILVVDDDEAAARLVAHQLSLHDVEVDRVTDGEAALEMAMRRGYDCVLLKLSVEGMSGLELAERLREQGFRGMITVMATLDADGHERCLAAGIDGHLPTPTPPEVFGDLVARLGHVPVESIYQSDPAMHELLTEFVRTLPGAACALEQAARSNDRPGVAALSRSLQQSARSYGFEPIVEAAERLEKAAPHGTRDEIRRSLDEVITRCQCVEAPMPLDDDASAAPPNRPA